MAGAGFKTFNTGDVLTASDVNTYLMQQTVMVFDDASARTTALTGVVAEGMLSYLKDTNAVEVYDGSSWVASDDPNAIQNSIVDAKGDLISATADNTPARLAVGADNTVLTADSSTATGLKWAAIPAASFVGVRVNNGSTSHSIPNNTNTALTWNAENYDSDGFHSTATNTSRLTVPSGKAGYYKIWGCNVFDVDATGRRTAQIQVNGTTYITRDEPTASASAYPGAVVTTTYYLNDGDYVEYVVFQTSGTTMGLPNSASSANFGMERLG